MQYSSESSFLLNAINHLDGWTEDGARWSSRDVFLVEQPGLKLAKVGINAANVAWPREFNINLETSYGNWIYALVNSAVYFASALFGCWL